MAKRIIRVWLMLCVTTYRSLSRRHPAVASGAFLHRVGRRSAATSNRSILVARCALAPLERNHRSYSTRRESSSVDDQGRRIRNRSDERPRRDEGWDEYDDGVRLEDPRASVRRPSRDEGRDFRFSRSTQGKGADRRPGASSFGNVRSGGRRGVQHPPNDPDGRQRRIDMNALEGAGFVHLYGLSPVLNALHSNRRDLTNSRGLPGARLSNGDDEDLVDEWQRNDDGGNDRKPEAQFRPWVFLQEKSRSGRDSEKAAQERAILKLAAERDVPVATVDKGVLNTLSGNRPHQGVCMRCGRLKFAALSKLPLPDGKANSPRLWLVLDEVVDPQNLGALIRSAYFLGGGDRVGVLVCAKNSAPPSPVVSAASAGALELLSVFSTSNLPRTLAAAEQDGFVVLGASSSVTDLDIPVYDLQNLPFDSFQDRPTVLVLGSEGSGLRHLVAKSCTHFVRIPRGDERDDRGGDESSILGVDSLNVSVTGGILLWRLLQNTG